MAGLTYCSVAERAEPIDGMVRLDLLSGGDQVSLLLTRYAALSAVSKLKDCISEMDRTPDPVIPLCELCVRYDLPKDAPAAKREG